MISRVSAMALVFVTTMPMGSVFNPGSNDSYVVASIGVSF